MQSDWDDAVARVRQHDGFEDFLRRTPFPKLSEAAGGGPIVLLNISHYRSDGLIVVTAGSPHLVPLPTATPERVEAIARSIALVHANTNMSDQATQLLLETALRDIWDYFAHPIVQFLEDQLRLPRGSRIWWCLTGQLWSLPFHASGPYQRGQRNLPDRYISSYVPSITSLLRLRQAAKPQAGGSPPRRVLIVAQPTAENERALAHASAEVAQVQEAVSEATIIAGCHSTQDLLLPALQQTECLHFVCHGHQDPNDPFASRFSLKEPVNLLDITRLRLQHGQLAFLAACHTAAGDLRTPDEVLHLAAGMLFTGFRSVVGSMWACTDVDGPVLAGAFYRHLFRNGPGEVDYTESAAALSAGVKELRRRKVPLVRWICYVHYGL